MPDYIEREAAYADFEKCNAENPKWAPSRVKALIARQPTADVAPVVHGRWEKKKHKIYGNDYDFVCSCCGCNYALAEYNYRPNCGCKMDGDRK